MVVRAMGAGRFLIRFWFERRQYKKVLPAKDLQEARKFAATWKGQIASGHWNPAKKRIMLADAGERYYRDYAAPTKPRRQALDDFWKCRRLEKFFSGKYLDEITPLDVQRMRTWLSDQFNLSEVSVNRYHQFLKAVINKVKLWGLYDGDNPASKVSLANERPFWRDRYLNQDEINRLLKVCCPTIAPIVSTAIYTGLRKGELLGLKVREVNFKSETIMLPKTKGGGGEWVPMPSELIQVLTPLLTGKRSEEFVFSSINFDNRWRQAKKDANLLDIHFHDLRHTYASHMVQITGNMAVVQKLLRHRKSEHTQRYAHLAPQQLKTSVAMFAAQIKAVPYAPAAFTRVDEHPTYSPNVNTTTPSVA